MVALLILTLFAVASCAGSNPASGAGAQSSAQTSSSAVSTSTGAAIKAAKAVTSEPHGGIGDPAVAVTA